MPADKTPRTPSKAIKPYSMPFTPQTGSSAATRLITPLTDNEASSPSSDGASEYRPPTPSPMPNNHDDIDIDVDDEIDTKPNISDEDFFAPTKKGKGKAKASPKKKSTGGERAVGRPWTGEERWVMFQEVRPKAKPNWAEIAKKVGRDAKSCQNHYAAIEKKMKSTIENMM